MLWVQKTLMYFQKMRGRSYFAFNTREVGVININLLVLCFREKYDWFLLSFTWFWLLDLNFRFIKFKTWVYDHFKYEGFDQFFYQINDKKENIIVPLMKKSEKEKRTEKGGWVTTWLGKPATVVVGYSPAAIMTGSFSTTTNHGHGWVTQPQSNHGCGQVWSSHGGWVIQPWLLSPMTYSWL
jgi:hypothetical protein